MLIDIQFKAIARQFSKRLELAKKAISKLNASASTHTGTNDFDRDDLLYIAHSSLWSSLEGFVNFLLEMLGFRISDKCGVHVLNKLPENLDIDSYTGNNNALIIFTDDKKVHYYNRITRRQIKTISLDSIKYEKLLDLLGLKLSNNLNKEPKILGNEELKKIKKEASISHNKLKKIDDKLSAIKNLFASITINKGEKSFQNDLGSIIESLDAVISIVSDKDSSERNIRNNYTHLNVNRIKKKASSIPTASVQKNIDDFYSSGELDSYYAHGLTPSIVENTFSVFSKFFTTCRRFFQENIDEYNLFMLFANSVSNVERIDRLTLLRLLSSNKDFILASASSRIIKE